MILKRDGFLDAGWQTIDNLLSRRHMSLYISWAGERCVRCWDLLKSTNQTVMKFGTDVQYIWAKFNCSLHGQGQSWRSNPSYLIYSTRLWFKTSSENLSIQRSNFGFGIKYEFRQNSGSPPGGIFRSKSACFQSHILILAWRRWDKMRAYLYLSLQSIF